MSKPPRNYRGPRVDAGTPCDPNAGTVRWAPEKSLWFTAMFSGWVIGGALYFSWAAVAVFLTLSAIILCFGHSLGMHRKLIHESFACPKPLEYLLVWLGTLVGLGGPFSMMYTHDVRDWAQRQPQCHPFLSHQSKGLRDFWWQVHCKLDFNIEPKFHYPAAMTQSRFYRALQASSTAQQIPLAIFLWLLGGPGFVFWGICGRVCVSIFGHWAIGYRAHNHGPRDYHIHGAAVQGHNVPFFGLMTFGECWHNNHHAFPGSAKLGLSPGQSDPGWWGLCAFEKIGLVWDITLPADLPARAECTAIGHEKSPAVMGEA